MYNKLSDYFEFPLGAPMAGSAADPDSLGYVYVVGFNEAGVVKIGSALAPGIRLIELQCGNPFELKLLATVSIYEGSAVLVERAAHRLAGECKIRGEWFELDPDEAVACILKAARNCKARFGAYAKTLRETQVETPDFEAERRAALRVKLGID